MVCCIHPDCWQAIQTHRSGEQWYLVSRKRNGISFSNNKYKVRVAIQKCEFKINRYRILFISTFFHIQFPVNWSQFCFEFYCIVFTTSLLASIYLNSSVYSLLCNHRFCSHSFQCMFCICVHLYLFRGPKVPLWQFEFDWYLKLFFRSISRSLLCPYELCNNYITEIFTSMWITSLTITQTNSYCAQKQWELMNCLIRNSSKFFELSSFDWNITLLG